MGVPNVVYKWKSLRTLYVSVFVMNIAGCFIVIIMIVSAIKLRMGIGQYLDMVVPGDANFWPGMMFLIAFMCAPIYAIGIRLCFHLRFFSPNSVPRLNQVLFIHCMLCFASMMVVIGINTIGIFHMVNFHRINPNGIIESMQKYATEVVSKIRVDMIQIKFQCCGSKSFKDWFHLKWMQKDGETTESKDHNGSTFVSTDVPFSCCATEMLQPCIHHDILKPSEVYLYQPEHRLTIATTGCQAKVISHARYVGGLLIVALILLAAYQMVLALLSRLLQTAHSNAFYIGPRKGRYLSWILGSMPNADMYNRLVNEGTDASADEIIPLQENVCLRLLEMDMDEVDENCQCSYNEDEKLLGIKSSKSLDVKNPSLITVRSLEERKKSSSVMEVLKKTSNTNSIPTPPPSPDTEDKSVPGDETRLYRGTRTFLDEEKMKTVGMKNRKRRLSKVMSTKVSKSQLKELRESLECLEKYQSPWKGGSPIFETGKSTGSHRELSQVNDSVERGSEEEEDDDWVVSELERHRSSSTSLSDYEKYKVRSKDSIEKEREEMRMKKFCKDLSTEYKKSPYSKQRRDFSEDTTHQSRLQNTEDSGRMIRNVVCAKFNPADTYSRFRGSVQDTMMRRSSQTHPGPPPIPISDQRTIAVHHQCRPRQLYTENPSILDRTLPYNQLLKPRGEIGGSTWSPNEKQGWIFRCPPAPTYFPISSRPPRPPRLPPCPYGVSHQSHHSVQNQSRRIRPLQFRQNAELVVPHAQREMGKYVPGLQPPRFSGC